MADLPHPMGSNTLMVVGDLILFCEPHACLYILTLSTFDNFNIGDQLSQGFLRDNDAPIPIAEWYQLRQWLSCKQICLPYIERGCGCDQRSRFANARAFDYPPHGAWFWCINLAAEPLKALIDLRIAQADVFCSLVLVVCTSSPIAGGFV